MLQTAIISENLIKPLKKFSFSDQQFLWVMRMNIILVALIAVLFAYWKANIYELVAEASITLLVSLLVPLTAGLYWHKSSKTGALWSIFSGMAAYLLFIFIIDIQIPAHLAALMVSLMAMVAGSYLYPKSNYYE
ncbi:MAG: hypothetical protein WD398_05310 [Cyclobacteriaceae bacterium]